MRSLKTECTVLALAMLAGFAHANEDSAKAQEALTKTKNAIEAELSKPMTKPLAPAVVRCRTRANPHPQWTYRSAGRHAPEIPIRH